MTRKNFPEDVICPRCGNIIEAESQFCRCCGLDISDVEEAAFTPIKNVISCVYGPPKGHDFMI